MRRQQGGRSRRRRRRSLKGRVLVRSRWVSGMPGFLGLRAFVSGCGAAGCGGARAGRSLETIQNVGGAFRTSCRMSSSLVVCTLPLKNRPEILARKKKTEHVKQLKPPTTQKKLQGIQFESFSENQRVLVPPRQMPARSCPCR